MILSKAVWAINNYVLSGTRKFVNEQLLLAPFYLIFEVYYFVIYLLLFLINLVKKLATLLTLTGIIKKTRTVMECLHRFCRECIDKSMRLGYMNKSLSFLYYSI